MRIPSFISFLRLAFVLIRYRVLWCRFFVLLRSWCFCFLDLMWCLCAFVFVSNTLLLLVGGMMLAIIMPCCLHPFLMPKRSRANVSSPASVLANHSFSPVALLGITYTIHKHHSCREYAYMCARALEHPLNKQHIIQCNLIITSIYSTNSKNLLNRQ